MDCTFCLDCVHACPHDNIGILSRVPAAELMVDPLRSGIGYFSRRKDLAALAIVFSFGALLNALGMVSPVYALESWLGKLLHVSHEAPVLGLIFAFLLVVEPVMLLGFAAWLTRTMGGSRRAILPSRRAIQLRAGPAGIWDVAGALRLPFLNRPAHLHSRYAKCSFRFGYSHSWRTSVDADRLAGEICAATGVWVSDSGVGRLTAGGVPLGGRRFRRAPDDGFRTLGRGLPADLGLIDLADAAADGDARHAHELLAIER